ncbi:MAG: MBL fold metallo-hydrolase [Marinilabiliaceae bacterium]|nr:MBL fold metallo-hydrolase [Marinilabiliaceae bacterium]
MIEVCALASGSNGNCYYIGNESEAILVDVGISRRQIVDRMRQVGLSINKVKAIFISHEHSDHSRGVRVLHQKLCIPVYMTSITYNNSRDENRPEKYVHLKVGEWLVIGDIKVKAFSKSHDAVDPCSFIVKIGEKTVGVMTDIGKLCNNVVYYFNLCHAVFLETNYDHQMLMDGPYPLYLKHRVASDRGHLSNNQAVELVEKHGSDVLKYIFLSHISQENNHPDIALKAFDKLKGKYLIELTNRYAPTQVFQL